MENEYFTQEKRRKVAYKDLLPLSPLRVLYELLISSPWLFASWCLYHYFGFVPALACSFVFFLTGLRQAHNAYHYALGLSKAKTEWVIFFLSLVMLCSMHAVKYNHLRHHKYCLDEEDVEGKSARMPWWKALLYGPVFPLELHLTCFKKGKKAYRPWMMAEVFCILALYVFGAMVDFPLLHFHLLAMGIGNCLTAFFAVWTVHHDCDPKGIFSRTLRGKWMPRVFYNMFYHTEHHLFPAVPTCHLPELAKRVDEVFPELKSKQVF